MALSGPGNSNDVFVAKYSVVGLESIGGPFKDFSKLRFAVNKSEIISLNKLRDNKLSGIVITHYQRLLDYLQPDTVHILAEGKIIKTGDKSLALKLEEKGYQGITEAN